MTRFPVIALAILFCCASALAQVTYSFDNFDTRNGVRVQVEPPPLVQTRVTRARRPICTTPSQNTGTEQSLSPVVLDSSRSLISPTALSYESPASFPNSGTALRGYTTGSSEVDGYLISSGTRF